MIKQMGAVSKIETRYLQTSEYPLWDSFVDTSPDGTIFHKTLWLQPVSEWQNLNFSIVACFKGGKITGGMAFTWKKKFGKIPVIQMPLKTPVFGPVISKSEATYQSKAESHNMEVVRSLSDFLLSEYQMFHAQFPPSVLDIRPFSWQNFRIGVHYTYQFHLIPENDILTTFDHSVRKQIKKGEKLEYTLNSDGGIKEVSNAWKLEQKSFSRQNFRMVYASESEFSKFLSSLIEKELARIYTIYLSDNPVASRIVIMDRAHGTIYDWLAGADKEFLSTGLNQLLMFRVLTELQDSKFDLFDFGGAGTESIARYKSTYNFQIVPMYSASMERGLAQLGNSLKRLRN